MSSRERSFDPRSHASVTLSVNDKIKDRGFSARQEPLKNFVIRPTTPRPGSAPGGGHDPLSPRFMDAKGRWTLPSPQPNLLHSVTQPLSATDPLASSVHVASSTVGNEGDINPVVAVHSYGDASPVATSDEVVEARRQRSRSLRSPQYLEQQEQLVQRERQREKEQQRVRQQQEEHLRNYEQQLWQQQLQQQQQQQREREEQEQQQREQQAMKASNGSGRLTPRNSSVLRPGSPAQFMPRQHMTQSFSAGPANGNGTVRPQSASPYLNSMRGLGSQPMDASGYRTNGSFGTQNGSSMYGSGRLHNSFKAHNDKYYRLPKRPATSTLGGRTQMSRPTQGVEEPYHASGTMNGMTQRSDQFYTQNGHENGKPWEYDPTYGKEPSASGPFASAAENPYWPKSSQDCLKPSDLQRSIDLGKSSVPSAPNCKLVGGKWKYIPRPTSGDVVYTDYYGPVGGGNTLANYYGRAYGMDTADFAKQRLIDDYAHGRVRASMMGIQSLKDRPGLSMDASIVHGRPEELQGLERSSSGRGLHKITQHYNLRPSSARTGTVRF